MINRIIHKISQVPFNPACHMRCPYSGICSEKTPFALWCRLLNQAAERSSKHPNIHSTSILLTMCPLLSQMLYQRELRTRNAVCPMIVAECVRQRVTKHRRQACYCSWLQPSLSNRCQTETINRHRGTQRCIHTTLWRSRVRIEGLLLGNNGKDSGGAAGMRDGC